MSNRPYAVVTGASTGIGYELAKRCAEEGYDLLIVAEEAKVRTSAQALRTLGVEVEALQADLATFEGVEKVRAAINVRPVDALLANAARSLGKHFFDQNFNDIQRVVDTNITGTLYLLHKIGRDMRVRGTGRILITGSSAGLMPGTFQAVYHGTKAFLDSFAAALRNELKDSAVTVTCLIPGASESEVFKRAEPTDTRTGDAAKDDPATVAEQGFEAMIQGATEVITGWKNKLTVAASRALPSTTFGESHRGITEPGAADR